MRGKAQATTRRLGPPHVKAKRATGACRLPEEPSPPAPSPSLKEEAGLVAALKSYELQEWLRVLCRMHVLTQQMLLGGLEYDELIPLWAKRMKVILSPPPLFESIKLARTEKGVTWHVVETAKLVAVLQAEMRPTPSWIAALNFKEHSPPCLARCGTTHRLARSFRIITASCLSPPPSRPAKWSYRLDWLSHRMASTCTSSTTAATPRPISSSTRS